MIYEPDKTLKRMDPSKSLHEFGGKKTPATGWLKEKNSSTGVRLSNNSQRYSGFSPAVE